MFNEAKIELILNGPSGTNPPQPSPIIEESDTFDEETTSRDLLAPRRPRLESDCEEITPSILYGSKTLIH